MNKKELIERMEGLKNIFGNKCEYIEIDTVIELASELDEPQKVTIPQFVADWLKYCKLTGVDLYHALEMGDLYFGNYANQKDDLKLKEFFETENNRDIFARAWLDGYDVEKEKRYSVKIKGEIVENLLVYGLGINRYFFARTYDSSKRNEHTREELEKAGFGWVFDCPGVEIEVLE